MESGDKQSTAMLLTCGVLSVHALRQIGTCSTARENYHVETFSPYVLIVLSLSVISAFYSVRSF